jgi:hypothetical protein
MQKRYVSTCFLLSKLLTYLLAFVVGSFMVVMPT